MIPPLVTVHAFFLFTAICFEPDMDTPCRALQLLHISMLLFVGVECDD
jgi:hypothetical protein